MPGPSFFGGVGNVVFVQTDNTAGNQVVAYDRAPGGTLSLAGTYNTGGLGGQLSGSVVDHLASQGSLTYDQRNNLLYAVNAGSNTVSVFSVQRRPPHLASGSELGRHLSGQRCRPRQCSSLS